jgi:hypothetical protein
VPDQPQDLAGAPPVVDDRSRRDLLRHTVATLAYRAAKAVRGAPDGFGTTGLAGGTRPPVAILAHIGDLMDWACHLADGHHRWHDSTPGPWAEEVERCFAAIARFEARLAAADPLGHPAERLFQGPVADALTHVGQIALLRRHAGSPVRGENYFKADIAVGRVGLAQAPPRMEFD